MARPIGGKTKLTEKMVFTMTPLMKELIRDVAASRKISEGNLVREAMAKFLGLDLEHINSVQKLAQYKPRTDPVRPTVVKRMFHDVPHPLEAALRRVALPPDENEDKDG